MPENLETSKQTQIAQLRELSNFPGWKILEYKINEQLNVLRNQLENDGAVNMGANQSQIKAYKTILRWVEESKGSKKNGKT